jgi:hypothetical protein
MANADWPTAKFVEGTLTLMQVEIAKLIDLPEGWTVLLTLDE